MKKLIAICLLMSTIFTINAQEQKEYYDNGQLKSVGKRIDGTGNGEWKYYHENGELIATKFYDVNGKEIEIKKAPIEIKANNDFSNNNDYDFPQIQKYLDKINEIDMGYDKLAKLSQKLKGKTFTSIETYDGEVSKDYYENISWGDFKYAKYIEHEDAKMYIRCDFEFKTNFLKTTKYSSKEDNILSCFIFKKDILAVKQAIEEFEENLVQKFISTQNLTQRTEYEGAKTWKIVSSLMGENLENVKKILQNNNMVVKKNGIDKDTGLDIWNFVALSEKNDEYTSPYTVAFKNNKVVMAMVPYGYFSKETTNLLKDLSELKKDIKLFGFKFTDKQTEEHRSSFGGGVWYTFNYFFNKINENKEVRIFYEPNEENFTLMIGEKKYLDLMSED